MRLACTLVAALLCVGCPGANHNATPPGDSGPPMSGFIAHPCTLPGTIQFTEHGPVTVPGGPSGAAPLDFLKLPAGFCAHWYATIGDARQIKFAPGGELFVASPTSVTTGGGPFGQAAIIVLPDDDRDGVADTPVTFLQGLPSTQGLLFANDSLYYQDHTKILRLPYHAGDRAPSGSGEVAVDITYSMNGLHWPKTLDIADDGKIYVGNGGGQLDACVEPRPTLGAIVLLDGTPGGTPIVKGLRNPISVRCAKGHNHCFALELAKDYTADHGGREKMFLIRPGDDWGFPCCATKGLPYPKVTNQDGGVPDCSGVEAENNAFRIGDTPFGLEFEPGNWPGMWARRAFVATHGAAGTLIGARIVAVPMDPTAGLPMPSSNAGDAGDQGMDDFATGWDDGTLKHGRPAALAFAPDGRLFVASDFNGVIFWVAPM
jgi:glucose/arabinose dehydrogenase